ncbi:Endo-1,4-beta-xylanase A precursor [compost metagenome]
MVMTYNILSKLGKIQPDETLSALELFKDSGDVADYAKLAVSSLIKNEIISGDGAFIYPNKKMNNAEAMVLAKSLNVYRYR